MVATLSLWDDGVGADEERKDGVYSGWLTAPLESGTRYEVTVMASCEDNCRVRPDDSFSFVPVSDEDVLHYDRTHAFERQVGGGSIKYVGYPFHFQ